jgi:transcriptional regulator with XRE-family HTH domain
MTGDDLRAIRTRLGLSLQDWGLALGYSGPHTRQQIYKIEVGIAPLTGRTARLARMYELYGIPDEFRAAARAAAPRPAGGNDDA